MGKSSLEVDILGTSFSVQSDADPRHLARVVEYLRSKIKAIQASASHYEPIKICLLAALNVVDELFQAREAGSSAQERPAEGPEATEIERITESLIEKIDRSLLAK
jgi:cell division protein ZapA (FtsZ GTPase activity inhibitor)